MKGSTSSILERANRFIAGGVVSLNRKVEPSIVFVRGKGAFLFDSEGNRYIDYHAAFAPHLLGHNDPDVNQAVQDALSRDWSLMGSGTTPWEAELAELLCTVVPSMDTVQITNTGSEATAHAIRLSRAATGRTDIVLTVGGYNGWHNDVARAVMPTEEQIGPRVSPGEYPFVPLSDGIPDGVKSSVHLVNFNDLESVEYVLRKHKIACVMTEPVLQNVGVVLPHPGYLEGLQELCERYGALLVLDEVKTGFRSALGGYQSLLAVAPHLSVFGKAVANGFPMGVIGGRREIMGLFAEADMQKRVLIAGTYNAHPVACAAAIATIAKLRDGVVHRELERRGRILQRQLARLFEERGIEAVICRNASAFCIYFMDHPPIDWHDILTHHDFEFDLRYRKALIARGVYHFPLPCKQSSVSWQHDDQIISDTLEKTRTALYEL